MDKISSEHRSRNMSRIRSKNTVPEMIVRRLVHSMGFRYRLHVTNLPGKPDLVFPRLQKVIQVNGCFFHQHEECKAAHVPLSRKDYWIPKLAHNKNRDIINEAKLLELGWDVLILWECEVKQEPILSKRVKTFLLG